MTVFAIAGVFGEKYKARAVDIEGKASTFLEQILSSIRIVQAFAAEKVLAAKYNVYLDEVRISPLVRSTSYLPVSSSFRIMAITRLPSKASRLR